MLHVNGNRKWLLRVLGATVLATLMVAAIACSSSPAENSPATGGATSDKSSPSAAATAPAAAKVAKAKIDSCAGFTTEEAAKILQVPAASLKANKEQLYESAVICSYLPTQGSSMGTGVVFSLAADKTVEAAVESMADLREKAHIAKTSIEGVTGNKDQGPASRVVDGIGDEAIWVQANGALFIRVGNVTVSVMEPSDIERQQQVAKLAVSGLR